MSRTGVTSGQQHGQVRQKGQGHGRKAPAQRERRCRPLGWRRTPPSNARLRVHVERFPREPVVTVVPKRQPSATWVLGQGRIEQIGAGRGVVFSGQRRGPRWRYVRDPQPCTEAQAIPREDTAMSYARAMLDTYPRDYNVDTEKLVACIEACYDCANACTQCADACLSEEQVAELVKCIRLNSDCADVCITTGRILSRQTEYDANVARAALEACAAVCKACGDECEHHAGMGMEHCRVCTEACRRCEQACADLLAAIS